ncbi:hypothetical protein PYCCODRAFT_1301713 [Trametes coccinea BRFM310]|uniref:Uncharacterized protein n=1 Tax=Trametes coccinea (strain BRFM310) TaxID=1353009 RepID=A0A1Y2IVS1_TRAC3|nr:hypothetical protein PYCCODRAFT_1301713 [Trametes coccinea BRFM310]
MAANAGERQRTRTVSKYTAGVSIPPGRQLAGRARALGAVRCDRARGCELLYLRLRLCVSASARVRVPYALRYSPAIDHVDLFVSLPPAPADVTPPFQSLTQLPPRPFVYLPPPPPSALSLLYQPPRPSLAYAYASSPVSATPASSSSSSSASASSSTPSTPFAPLLYRLSHVTCR